MLKELMEKRGGLLTRKAALIAASVALVAAIETAPPDKVVEARAKADTSLAEITTLNGDIARYDSMIADAQAEETRRATEKPPVDPASVRVTVLAAEPGSDEYRGKQRRALNQWARGSVQPELRVYLGDAAGLAMPGVEHRDLGSSVVIGDRPFSQVYTAKQLPCALLSAGCPVEDTPTGNPENGLFSDDSSNVGKVIGENAALNGASVDPTESNVMWSAWAYTSDFVKVSNQRLRDSAFDVQAYVEGIADTRIFRKLDLDTIAGAGTATAKGLLTGLTNNQATLEASVVSFKDIANLFFKLKAPYRRNLSQLAFIGSTSMAQTAFTLLDSQNRPIWVNAQQAPDGQPKLWGIDFFESENMAAIADSAIPLAIVYKPAYVFRHVSQEVFAKADQLFIGSNQTGFVKFAYYDARLADSYAAAKLTVTAA